MNTFHEILRQLFWQEERLQHRNGHWCSSWFVSLNDDDRRSIQFWRFWHIRCFRSLNTLTQSILQEDNTGLVLIFAFCSRMVKIFLDLGVHVTYANFFFVCFDHLLFDEIFLWHSFYQIIIKFILIFNQFKLTSFLFDRTNLLKIQTKSMLGKVRIQKWNAI